VAARPRAVCCVAFLANGPAIGLLAAKRRLAAHPDPHYHRHARVLQVILEPRAVFHAIWHIKKRLLALAVLPILAISPGIAAVCALPEPKPLFFMGASKRKTRH
jgi:hypothetical protein